MTAFPNHLQVRPCRTTAFSGEPAVGLTLRDMEHIFGVTEARDIAGRMLAAAEEASGGKHTSRAAPDAARLDQLIAEYGVYARGTKSAQVHGTASVDEFIGALAELRLARTRLAAMEQIGLTEDETIAIINAARLEAPTIRSIGRHIYDALTRRAALAPAPIVQGAKETDIEPMCTLPDPPKTPQAPAGWEAKLDEVAATIQRAALTLAGIPTAFKQPAPRQIVQVSISESFTTALCNDGSLWGRFGAGAWSVYPDIPQPSALPHPETPDSRAQTADTSLGGQRVEAPVSETPAGAPINADGLIEAACRQEFDLWFEYTDYHRRDVRDEMRRTLEALRDIGALIPWAARVMQAKEGGVA